MVASEASNNYSSEKDNWLSEKETSQETLGNRRNVEHKGRKKI